MGSKLLFLLTVMQSNLLLAFPGLPPHSFVPTYKFVADLSRQQTRLDLFPDVFSIIAVRFFILNTYFWKLSNKIQSLFSFFLYVVPNYNNSHFTAIFIVWYRLQNIYIIQRKQVHCRVLLALSISRLKLKHHLSL